MDYNNLLKNKTALVTAGANGIGYAIAKKFEESGAKVFVCDINQDAVDMVNKNHQNIKAIFCDLSQTQMISSMVESAFDYFCLLYTSPSPRDDVISRMPSSA